MQKLEGQGAGLTVKSSSTGPEFGSHFPYCGLQLFVTSAFFGFVLCQAHMWCTNMRAGTHVYT